MKLLATFLLLVVAALIVIPLIVLAGLFIWLKLTEEGDEESLDLDQDNI
jgi:ABC-type phosphate transport system permease subunit